MPQAQMPFFPEGAVHINALLAFTKANGHIAYVSGGMQLCTHPETDRAAFLMTNAQFCVNGITKQSEVATAFGIPALAIKRAVKLYRQEGVRGFFKPRQRRGAAVLTAAVRERVQGQLDAGLSLTEVAEQTNLKRDTLAKSVRAGRLRAPVCLPTAPVSATSVACSKSERSEQDSSAAMGMGAVNVVARIEASLGQLTAVAPQFQCVHDVPFGGVLFALPALLAMGLLDGAESFLKLPDGYYGLDSLLLLSAFMALARLKSIESLRYCAPGEWGKLLGLDRIVRSAHHA